MFAFEGCTEWVSKLVFEPQEHRAYAISDTTVTILNLKTRKVESVVSDMHETPVTACIWYPRDKFYITSCMNGRVRCWFVKDVPDDKYATGGQIENGGVESGSNAVTLHAFNAHGRAVTPIKQFTASGLF